jgi:hypothetical protein
MMKRLLLIALLGCTSVLGQTPNGVVSGKIRDQDGNPVPSVQILLTRPTSSSTSSGQTNADGSFRIGPVQPGEYQLIASAFQTTIFPGTADAARAIVLVSNRAGPAIGAPRMGTYFPGTADGSKATAINVGLGVENTDITLATVPTPWNDPALRAIHGRIVVEGGGTLAHTLGDLSLFFSDGPDGRAANLTFLDKPVVASSIRFEPPTFQNTLDSVNSVTALPSPPNGEFRLYIRTGAYRVLQLGPPLSVQTGRSGSPGFYIKGLSFGATDLMKELMKVQEPTKDELIITLAQCTAAIKDEPRCR